MARSSLLPAFIDQHETQTLVHSGFWRDRWAGGGRGGGRGPHHNLCREHQIRAVLAAVLMRDFLEVPSVHLNKRCHGSGLPSARNCHHASQGGSGLPAPLLHILPEGCRPRGCPCPLAQHRWNALGRLCSPFRLAPGATLNPRWMRFGRKTAGLPVGRMVCSRGVCVSAPGVPSRTLFQLPAAMACLMTRHFPASSPFLTRFCLRLLAFPGISSQINHSGSILVPGSEATHPRQTSARQNYSLGPSLCPTLRLLPTPGAPGPDTTPRGLPGCLKQHLVCGTGTSYRVRLALLSGSPLPGFPQSLSTDGSHPSQTLAASFHVSQEALKRNHPCLSPPAPRPPRILRTQRASLWDAMLFLWKSASGTQLLF